MVSLDKPHISQKTIELKTYLARVGAIQGIYRYQLTEENFDDILLDSLKNPVCYEIKEEVMNGKPNTALLGFLLKETKKNQEMLSDVIQKSLVKGWTLDRLDLVLRSVLLVGLCELLYRSDALPKMVVSEYTKIAFHFLEEKEAKMVNAVLDQASKK